MKVTLMAVSVIPVLVIPGIANHRSVAGAEPRALHELTVDVDLSTRRLVVRVDGRQAGSYEVAIGKPEHRTPRPSRRRTSRPGRANKHA